jgi:serine/threonine protein kinase
VKVEPGQLIGGKYELERLLGKGSMGEVWRARHATLEDSYAVKLIDVRRVPDAAGRFQLEAHIAAKLSKKTRHIVSVTDHGEDDQLAYLVMQLLEGVSLEQHIDEAAPLPTSEVATIVTQVARALKHAHDEGFVHRDIKPANIFLTKDEDGRTVVKLLDFGIARSRTKVATRSPFATAKDTVVGTPSYMSPEQTLGIQAVDHRCDLWSLAVVAYEALSKELPFEGETLQEVLINIGIGREVPLRVRRDDLPDAVYRFFEKAFADELSERFASATDLATTFARAVGLPAERASLPPPLSMTPAGTAAGAAAESVVSKPAPSSAAPPAPAANDEQAAKRESRDHDEAPIEVPMQRGSRRVVLFAVLGAAALIAVVVGVALRGGSAVVAQRREANAAVADAGPNGPSRSSTSSPWSISPSRSAAAPSSSSSSSVAPAASSSSSSAPPRALGAAPPPPPLTPSVPSSSAASSLAPVASTPPAASSAPPPGPVPAPARSVDRGEVF